MDITNRARTMYQLVRSFAWVGLTKPDMQAAVNAIDDWCDTNAVSFNTALPQPFRGVANASQKALLLAYVCMRRAGVLKAEED